MNEVMFIQLADDHRSRDFEFLMEQNRQMVLDAFRLPYYLFDNTKTDVAAYYQCTCGHYCDGCDCICHNGSPA